MPHTKIACTPLFDPLVSASGLHLPESSRERCDQGIVKYCGAECELVKPGDHILFSGYTGTLVQLEGEGLLIILPEEFVTCVIEYKDDIEVMTIPISGLYFKERNGSTFPANYEQAMNFIAKGLDESKLFEKIHSLAKRKTGAKNEVPTPEETERWR